jgi:hypothetical protein
MIVIPLLKLFLYAAASIAEPIARTLVGFTEQRWTIARQQQLLAEKDAQIEGLITRGALQSMVIAALLLALGLSVFNVFPHPVLVFLFILLWVGRTSWAAMTSPSG